MQRKLTAILSADAVGYSRLMAEDEPATVRLADQHRALLADRVAKHGGRVVDAVGDNLLAEFPSVVEAVSCAAEAQRELGVRNDALPPERRLHFRVGINLGDVMAEGDRIVGDGVNVAARIEGLAEPGGICLSGTAFDHVEGKLPLGFEDLGAQSLKNIPRPVRVYRVTEPEGGSPRKARGTGAGPSWLRAHPLRAVVFAAAILAAGVAWANRVPLQAALILKVGALRPNFEQEIAFTTTSDGVRIAYATSGEGLPVVQVLGWFTHLERGLSSPAFGWARGWENQFRFVRYDGRGTGLSDRGIEDFSLDARVRDLEAVVDASGLERFSLLAHSAGGPPAIAYAARYPERVEKVAFYGSFARLVDTPEQLEVWKQSVSLIRMGWGSDQAAYRQFFTSHFMPDGDEVAFKLFNEWQRIAADPEDAARFAEVLKDLDVRELAARVRAPTLVVHRRGDQAVPFRLGRELASLIPGARLHTLEGRNHAFLRGEPELHEMLDTVEAFFREP